MVTESIFCAHCQATTLHVLTIAGDILATCPECGRILKFPSTVTAPELTNLIAKHYDSNLGQEPVAPAQIGPADVHVEPGNPESASVAEDLTPAEASIWETTNQA